MKRQHEDLPIDGTGNLNISLTVIENAEASIADFFKGNLAKTKHEDYQGAVDSPRTIVSESEVIENTTCQP